MSTKARRRSRMDAYLLEDEDEDILLASPERKRMKNTAEPADRLVSNQGRGSKGKLSKLPNMPLDVLYEVFSFLDPLDLVNLGRTTKSLRSVVMSRSTRSIWMKALESVDGLPPCPLELSEPDYARLVFDNWCQECCSSRSTTVFWSWYRRLCKSCLRTLTTFNTRANQKQKNIWVEINKAMKYLFQVLPHEYVAFSRDDSGCAYLVSDIIKLEGDAARQIALGKDLKDVEKAYQTSSRIRRDHAKLCQGWETTVRESKSLERFGAQERRQLSIINNLKDLGWTGELDLYPDSYRGLGDLPAVNQPRDLTDRIWKKIKPAVIQFMENCKNARVSKERLERAQKRYEELKNIVFKLEKAGSPNDTLARAADIYFMPELHTKILECRDDEFEELIDDLRQDFSYFSRQCIRQRKKFLTKLVIKAHKSPAPAPIGVLPSSGTSSNGSCSRSKASDENPAAVDEMEAPRPDPKYPLQLATTWFKCTTGHLACQTPKDAEEIHHNECMFRFYKTRGVEDDTDAYKLRKSIGEQAWNLTGDRVEYSSSGAERAKQIVEACGKDPLVTTAKDMDDSEHRFLCVEGDKISVMSWRGLVKNIPRLIQGPKSTWRLLDDEELPEFSLLGPRPYDECWSCLICWKASDYNPNSINQPLFKLGKHFRECHHGVQMKKDNYYSDSLVSERFQQHFRAK